MHAPAQVVWWKNWLKSTPQCDFSQEPGRDNDHGSAPQISVTESTPDTNRKLVLPANQLQVPSQRDCSNSVKVFSILLCHYDCFNHWGFLLLTILCVIDSCPTSFCHFFITLFSSNRQIHQRNSKSSWIWSAIASVDAWMTSAVPWILLRVLPAHQRTQTEGLLQVQ